MEMLLESKADPMPHKTCNLRIGEKVVQKILPSGTKWKQILETVNEVIGLTSSMLGDERLRHFSCVLWALWYTIKMNASVCTDSSKMRYEENISLFVV
jgi:hypothetical protein